MKAGKIVSGEFSTEKAIKQGKAYLVIAASDASDNTKKHFSDMCAYRQVPYYNYSDKETLGKCIGKQMRASLAVVDECLAKAIIKEFMKMETE